VLVERVDGVKPNAPAREPEMCTVLVQHKLARWSISGGILTRAAGEQHDVHLTSAPRPHRVI
jgi:hypothetical protein